MDGKGGVQNTSTNSNEKMPSETKPESLPAGHPSRSQVDEVAWWIYPRGPGFQSLAGLSHL